MFRTDLISHTDFHKGFWYKSNYSNWYYFKEQERDYNLNNLDYSTVDKDLLPLVKLLHKNNIPPLHHVQDMITQKITLKTYLKK